MDADGDAADRSRHRAAARTTQRHSVAPDRARGRHGSGHRWLLHVRIRAAAIGYPVSALVAGQLGLSNAYVFAGVSCLATLILTTFAVPKSRTVNTPPTKSGVDVLGAVLLAGAASSALLVATQFEQWGRDSSKTWILCGVALASGIGFARRTLRVPAPLVDLRLALRPAVLAPHLTAAMAGAGMYVLLTAAMLLIQSPRSGGVGLGYSVSFAGLLFIPHAVGNIAVRNWAIRISRSGHPGLVLPLGCIVQCGAMITLATTGQHTWHVIVALLLSGIGSGCTFGAIQILLVAAVPIAETGSATAFNMLMRALGSASGSAVVPLIIGLNVGAHGQLTQTSLRLVMAAGLVNWLICLVVTGTLARRAHVRSSGRQVFITD
jgi:hypothetical protein